MIEVIPRAVGGYLFWFWWVLTMACVVWYSTITIYVAIRGAGDIKEMLKRLSDSAQDEPESPGGPSR